MTAQPDGCAGDSTRDWSFRLSLPCDTTRQQVLPSEDSPFTVPSYIRERFSKDGFVTLEGVLTSDAVAALNQRFEDVLLYGQYDRENSPDKVPNLIRQQPKESVSSSLRNTTTLATATTSTVESRTDTTADFLDGIYNNSGRHHNKKRTVLQVINIHKADTLYRTLACHPLLGRLVAELAHWTHVGTRLAQDQVWAKPPGCCKPISFHQDSPYFMFTPQDVVTVWVALDDMDDELGPLEYVKGSHRWKSQGCNRTNSQFFEKSGGMQFLRSAAMQAGEMPAPSGELEGSLSKGQHSLTCEEECRQALDIVSLAGLPAGSISIHNGRTWHGSGKNLSSTRPRRGLGLHYVPANVRFTTEALKSQLWRPYVESHIGAIDRLEVPMNDFPVTWGNPST